MTCDWLMQVAIFKPIQQLCLHYEFETCRPHVHIFLSRNQLYYFYFGLKIHSPYQLSVSYPTSSWKPAVNAVVFLHGSSTLKCNPSHVTKLTAVCDECKNSPVVWLVRSSREVSKVTKTHILIGWQGNTWHIWPPGRRHGNYNNHADNVIGPRQDKVFKWDCRLKIKFCSCFYIRTIVYFFSSKIAFFRIFFCQMTQETLYICFLKQVSFHVVNNWLISNIHVFSKYWIAKTIIQADIALTEMLKITKTDFQQNP